MDKRQIGFITVVASVITTTLTMIVAVFDYVSAEMFGWAAALVSALTLIGGLVLAFGYIWLWAQMLIFRDSTHATATAVVGILWSGGILTSTTSALPIPGEYIEAIVIVSMFFLAVSLHMDTIAFGLTQGKHTAT